jgi:hypothetical protein
LDHAALGEESLELFETMHLLMGKDKKTTKPIPAVVKSNTEEENLKRKKPKTSVDAVTSKKGFGKK